MPTPTVLSCLPFALTALLMVAPSASRAADGTQFVATAGAQLSTGGLLFSDKDTGLQAPWVNLMLVEPGGVWEVRASGMGYVVASLSGVPVMEGLACTPAELAYIAHHYTEGSSKFGLFGYAAQACSLRAAMHGTPAGMMAFSFGGTYAVRKDFGPLTLLAHAELGYNWPLGISVGVQASAWAPLLGPLGLYGRTAARGHWQPFFIGPLDVTSAFQFDAGLALVIDR